jgi:WhiB family redox-sensing transcriptional regulator
VGFKVPPPVVIMDIEFTQYIIYLTKEKFEWSEEAPCRAFGPDYMYPTSENSQTRVAGQLCFDCPFQVSCLNYALTIKEEYGVWGGTTEKDRKDIHAHIVEEYPNFKTTWSPDHINIILNYTQKWIYDNRKPDDVVEAETE